jgi:branched-subunit amino acid ABC-type transport system permease component
MRAHWNRRGSLDARRRQARHVRRRLGDQPADRDRALVRPQPDRPPRRNLLACLGTGGAGASRHLFPVRSRIGIGQTAMRDNVEGAAAIGVDITFSRILCFLGTAPFLGMAGAIITLQKLRIAPSASFSITDWTVFVIFNVVIGGIGSFEGRSSARLSISCCGNISANSAPGT